MITGCARRVSVQRLCHRNYRPSSSFGPDGHTRGAQSVRRCTKEGRLFSIFQTLARARKYHILGHENKGLTFDWPKNCSRYCLSSRGIDTGKLSSANLAISSTCGAQEEARRRAESIRVYPNFSCDSLRILTHCYVFAIGSSVFLKCFVACCC